MKAFDQKFGAAFFASLPTTPGIYKVFNEKGDLIYVGKAKNLRRRLGQYRNAKRRKKHYKMRKIVSEAARIEYDLHPTDHAACLAELAIIQEERPRWNLAGAFYFLYPMIGVAHDSRELTLLYSTELDKIPAEITSGLSMHGAYRSRHLSANAFFALVELLGFVGHQNPAKKIGKYSYVYSFRRIEPHWKDQVDLFLRGESGELMENLILALVESPTARRKSGDVQDLLNDLARFLRHETKLLARLTKALNIPYPISQRDRDVLLLKYREHKLANPTKKRARAASR